MKTLCQGILNNLTLTNLFLNFSSSKIDGQSLKYLLQALLLLKNLEKLSIDVSKNKISDQESVFITNLSVLDKLVSLNINLNDNNCTSKLIKSFIAKLKTFRNVKIFNITLELNGIK